EVGVPEILIMRGHLHLYRNDAALNGDAAWRLREQHGIAFTRIGRQQILELEPQAPADYNVGVYIEDQATVRNPFRYVQASFQKYKDGDGRFVHADVQDIQRSANDGWTLSAANGAIEASEVVVAAGAWSGRLLRPLGIKLPLETQRGYHVQFQSETAPVSR